MLARYSTSADKPEPFALNATSCIPLWTESSKLHEVCRSSTATWLPEEKARTPPSQLMVDGGRATAPWEVPLARASMASAETVEAAALNWTSETNSENDP